MRLMVDANIILDVLQAREPYLADSSAISRMCETKMAEGHISTLSLANLVYVMRKELDPEAIEEILKILSLIYRFDDLTQADLSNAASLKWNDFEDAVQAVIAKRIHADYIITRNVIHADYIITRNVKDFQGSEIMALTPSELLARI